VTADIAFPPTPDHAPHWWSPGRRPPTRRIGGRARRCPTTRRIGGHARRRPNNAPNWWSCPPTPKRRAELVVVRRARILPRLAPLRAIEIGWPPRRHAVAQRLAHSGAIEIGWCRDKSAHRPPRACAAHGQQSDSTPSRRRR